MKLSAIQLLWDAADEDAATRRAGKQLISAHRQPKRSNVEPAHLASAEMLRAANGTHCAETPGLKAFFDSPAFQLYSAAR